MSAKIYLVSRGCYSDYSILSVWSTRALADAEVERVDQERGLYDPIAEVEEFWLDGGAVEPLSQWSVRVRRDGDVIVEPAEKSGRVGYCLTVIDDPLLTDIILYGCVLAESEEHAVKIASEKRAEYLAQEGVTR